VRASDEAGVNAIAAAFGIGAQFACFTCFPSTKVQILTQKLEDQEMSLKASSTPSSPRWSCRMLLLSLIRVHL
jgi:hypothetical protein